MSRHWLSGLSKNKLQHRLSALSGDDTAPSVRGVSKRVRVRPVHSLGKVLKTVRFLCKGSKFEIRMSPRFFQACKRIDWEDLNPLRANNDRSSRSKCDQRIIYYYIVIANIIYIINSHTKAQNSLIHRYWSLHRTLLTKRTEGLT